MEPEDHLDNIITNLKIISLVSVNDKLSIRKGHLQIDNSSNFQFIKRWFYRDSRDIILIYLKDLVRCIKINEKSIPRLVPEIEKAIFGLIKLKITYSNDPIMVVTFENVIHKFKEILNKR